MHSEWKHHHYHGEPQQPHHHQGLTLTSNLASQQVLNVDVCVPVAAPVSLTLDAFKKTQAPSSSSVLPFDLFSNFSPSARIQQDGERGNHALDCQKFSSHSSHASHHSVSRTERNFESHSQEQRQEENKNVRDSKSREHHNCDLAEVSIVPDHLDIDDDDNHPPPTPQFDSNAMQQFHDVQPHQVQVDIRNSNVYSSQNRHQIQETMIPFPNGGGYGSLQNSIPHNYDCNSQMNGQHDIDAEENNEEEQFEKTLVPRDTLEVLKAIPLCTTAQEFEQKYPVELAMTPPDMTPIQHPTHSDILFGRGGLTNHHPGNKVYRTIVDMHKPDYQLAAKIVKPRVARRIVHAIRHSNLGARFLKKDPQTDMWYDVGDKAASEKTSQALREKSPEEKKAASSSNSNKDSVAVGYSMPSLTSTNANTIVLAPYLQGSNTTDLNAANSIVMPSPSPNLEMNQQSSPGVEQNCSTLSALYSDMDNHDQHHPQVQQLPILAYPVEGGTFGTVNASGQIVVTNQDILCGRGGATNHHDGNKRFRDIVALHRPDYIAAPKVRKPDVARKIVRAIRMANPPGRFLKKDDNGMWIDIGDKKAAEKCSQALREKGPEARKREREFRNNSTSISAAAITLNMYQSNVASQIMHYPQYLESNSTKNESATLPDISDDFEHDFNPSDRNSAEIDVSPSNPKRFKMDADEVKSPLKVHL